MAKITSILEQSCPEGQSWCPIHKKCIPNEERPGKGKHFGKGKGPIGIPKQEQEIEQAVDEVFDGGFDKFGRSLSVERQVDEILDKFSAPINTVKKGDVVNVKVSPTMQGGVDVRISESEVIDIMVDILESEDYKAYFRAKLRDAGYDSPADIPDDKKKEFFKAVDRGWKSEDETEEQMTITGSAKSSNSRNNASYGSSMMQKSYRGGFGSVRGAASHGGFGSISGKSKLGGFGRIKS